MQQMISNGFVFCLLCGEEKENQTMLMKHLSVEHELGCEHCKQNFADTDQISEHFFQQNSESIEFIEVPFEVSGDEVCNAESTDSNLKPEQKKNQAKKKLGSKPQFECEICSLVYSRKDNLRRHQQNFHPTAVEKYGKRKRSWPIGKEINKSNVGAGVVHEEFKSSCKLELDIEDGAKSLALSDCSVNSDDISRHVDVKTQSSFHMAGKAEDEEEMLSCYLCEFTCSAEQQMSAHHKEVHSLEELKTHLLKQNVSKKVSDKLLCLVCNKSYSKITLLKSHLIKKHGVEHFNIRNRTLDEKDTEIVNRGKREVGGNVVYQCEICKKVVNNKRWFLTHFKAHSGERPFTCHLCGKQYKTRGDLRQHIRFVHDRERNFPCEVCGRCFKNKCERDDHHRKHTKERPFICHTCGKSFPTHNSIYVHRRVHSDNFPHLCTTCGKKFRMKQHLVHHTRTHTGEKPFPCDICGISFSQKRYLKEHLKSRHANDEQTTVDNVDQE